MSGGPGHVSPGAQLRAAREGLGLSIEEVADRLRLNEALVLAIEEDRFGLLGAALQGLRDHGQVRPGHRVLINGASGGVGTFAIQISKRLGAHVSGVTSSGHVERIRALGADQVFDYTRQDFTRSDQRFDLLLDIAGSRSWRDVRRILKPDATLVIIGGPKSNRLIGPLGHVIQMRLGSLRARQKVIFFIANFNRQDFELLKGYLETDLKPVVQAAYPFGETADAIRLLGTGHAWGKIVVTVQGSS